MRRSTTAVLVAALGLVAAAPAAAAPLLEGPGALPTPPSPALIDRAEEAGTLSLERANLYRVYAVTGDGRLPAAYESGTPFDGTLLLMQAREELARMDPGPARREVATVLRAPPDPNVTNCDALSPLPLPNSLETPHFYIQYNAATIEPSLDIDDYAQSLETAWNTEVGAFGWAAPPASARAQAELGGKYHVRIDALAPIVYGYVSNGGTYADPEFGNNPNTPWNDVDADATCMGLNQDYTAFPGSPRQALDATTAHEFNHSLQFGYGALSGANAPDPNFVEGGATWMEDEVSDAADDNYNYLYPAFESSMGEHGGDEYAYWLTWRGLTERFGTNTAGAGEDVMQEFWELTSRNQSGSLAAMALALAKKGSSLAGAYHDYAVAAKFNAPCGGGYVLPYCFEEGQAYVDYDDEGNRPPNGETQAQGAVPAIGGSYSGSVEDNYALNWVSLPATGSYDVTVENTSPGGSLRVTLACDTGAAVALTRVPVALGPGAESTIPGFNPAGAVCQETVAVITNEAQTAANPSNSAPRSYSVGTTAASPTTTPVVATAPPPSSTTGTPTGTTPTPTTNSPITTGGPGATASRLLVGRATARRDGTVLIRVRLSGPGTVRGVARARVRGSLLSMLLGLTVARRTVRVTKPGLVTLRLKAGRRARRVIRRNRGRLRVKATLVFTPESGPRRTKAKRVTFRVRP